MKIPTPIKMTRDERINQLKRQRTNKYHYNQGVKIIMFAYGRHLIHRNTEKHVLRQMYLILRVETA